MTNGALVVLLVVVPCAFVLGHIRGWNRGRDHAERNLTHLTNGDPTTHPTPHDGGPRP